jgi:hypothetical protein
LIEVNRFITLIAPPILAEQFVKDEFTITMDGSGETGVDFAYIVP